jgi:peroxiredoxin
MSSRQTTVGLNVELGQMVAQIPGPIAERLATAAAAVTASGVAPGIALGERAPGFTLPNAIGQPVALADQLSFGPVVLSFYRGEWCPFCNTELRALQAALQAALPRFQAYSASLVAISPQAPDHRLSIIQKHSLSFEVLSDVHQEVIRAYRVQFTVPADVKDLHLNVFHNDLSTHTADGSWDLPIPGTFVIDRDGIVRARYVSADYTTRMEPAEIEAALAALN